MKKWAIPIAAAAIAIVAVAGGTFALTDSGDDESRISRDAGDRGESGGDGTGGDVAGICLEGAIDCDDTIENPGEVCIQIFPTPPECADPDVPVSNEPPIVDDPPANSCNFGAIAADCEEAAVALATEGLARRLGSGDGISLQSMEFVEWPDACLGVSNADIACAEVITPGYRIVFEAIGETYEYHTVAGSRAVLVE